MSANTPGQDPSTKTIDVLAAVDALPPLPAVALRVMEVAQNPKSSASDLALVVSSDPGLSGRLLRVVNSAAYRRSREITSVQEALVTIGFVQARNMAISGAIAGAYAPDALNALFRIDTFWEHSIAVAFKAAEYAGKGRRVDVPSAFTAGILHNLGRLAMFYADAAGLDQAVATAIATGESIEDVEAYQLGYDHAEIGGRLAAKWKLPETVRDAIAQHHSVSLDTDQTLAGCVAAADRYVCSNGLLPGYIVPVAAGEMRTVGADFQTLMRQVDALMQLVKGSPAGVKAA
jgi:putative nucleotidyltransferase with HDIG domain